MESGTVNSDSSASGQVVNFEGIYNYKFEENEKFLEGWKKVKKVVPKDKILDSLIKAQTFYFSREVFPVKYDEYRVWLTENGKDMHCFESLVSDESTFPAETLKSETSTSLLSDQRNEVLNTASSVDVVSKNERFRTETNSLDCTQHATVIETQHKTRTEDSENVKEDVKHPANFMELIEMIQAGMKLPDTEDLDIQPLNEDPTPCVLQRPKKPWDVS